MEEEFSVLFGQTAVQLVQRGCIRHCLFKSACSLDPVHQRRTVRTEDGSGGMDDAMDDYGQGDDGK